MKRNASNTVKILLAAALLLAVGTGVLAWTAFGPKSAPEAPTQVTEAEAPTTWEAAAEMENLPLSPLETLPNQQGRIQIPAILELSKQKGGSLEAERAIDRERIVSITFLDSLADAPENAWDASQAKNHAILAWTVPCASLGRGRELYIASEQVITAGSELDLSGFCNLREIHNLNLLDVSGTTSLNRAFSGMARNTDALLELDLSGWNVSSVTDFSFMFDGASLTSIDLSGWDVSSGTSFDGMFRGCDALTSVNLSGWNSPSAAGCVDMFFGCKSLKTLDIGNWRLPDGCAADRMLFDCKALDNVQELASALGAAKPLTQADFPQDKLTELTAAELKQAAEASLFPIYSYHGSCSEGDLSQCCSAYAKLDLDKDGLRDAIMKIPGEPGFSTYAVHFGNGTVFPFGVTNRHEWNCDYFEFLLHDINGSGKEDILAVQVHQYLGAGGTELSLDLFLDENGWYHRQNIQDISLSMEDLGNGYVRLSAPSVGYREVIPFDESTNVLRIGDDFTGVGFRRYFSPEGETEYRIQDVKLDGNKLVVMYCFSQSLQMYRSENPTAAVWRLEPGGYFVLERMGTDVIRDYYLTE